MCKRPEPASVARPFTIEYELFAALSGLDQAAGTARMPENWRADVVSQAAQAIAAATVVCEGDHDPRDVARSQLAFARQVFDLALDAVDPADQALPRADAAELRVRIADFQAQLDALKADERALDR